MSRPPVATSLQAVRRLAVTKQRLAGALPKRASEEDLISVVRDLAYVQWDPVPIVAPSHVLSFWARLGDFPFSTLDRLLWTEHRLLLHWIPIASIVSVEDYPIYASLMRRYPDSLSPSWGAQRAHARQFLARHAELRKKVLRALEGGPLRTNQFEEHLRT
ncbi:MAG TPA: crosslink repair DNA glycosylase YcaQ family protein, partial [Thermoplasmata archaeon]|nr:crosslink repair DNA glycosylase YcaQ family protein [Thermoplasmata archaeon]